MSPDISMCDNKKCKRRKKCYRFTAEPSEHMQSYFLNMKEKDCEYFWDNSEYKTNKE
jgi:hypothetical protein